MKGTALGPVGSRAARPASHGLRERTGARGEAARDPKRVR